MSSEGFQRCIAGRSFGFHGDGITKGPDETTLKFLGLGRVFDWILRVGCHSTGRVLPVGRQMVTSNHCTHVQLRYPPVAPSLLLDLWSVF